MKSFIIVVSALLFIVIAVAHAYRAYTGMHILVGTHEIPILVSWICAGVTAVLGLGLLFSRK